MKQTEYTIKWIKILDQLREAYYAGVTDPIAYVNSHLEWSEEYGTRGKSILDNWKHVLIQVHQIIAYNEKKGRVRDSFHVKIFTPK